jgi:hypothetical protein
VPPPPVGVGHPKPDPARIVEALRQPSRPREASDYLPLPTVEDLGTHRGPDGSEGSREADPVGVKHPLSAQPGEKRETARGCCCELRHRPRSISLLRQPGGFERFGLSGPRAQRFRSFLCASSDLIEWQSGLRLDGRAASCGPTSSQGAAGAQAGFLRRPMAEPSSSHGLGRCSSVGAVLPRSTTQLPLSPPAEPKPVSRGAA